MYKKNLKKSHRHPTEKKHPNPTSTHRSISIGTKEKQLLVYLKKNKERLNIKAYSRDNNLPRPTIYDYLNKLQRYGFVERGTANNIITEKGKIYLGVSDGGVGISRRGCRKKANLSTHYHKFKLPISNKDKFLKSRIKELSPLDYDENKLHNLHQIIIRFEDATIVINPKQLIINLYDIITEDVSESDIKSLSRAIEYAKKLMKIGVITEGIMLEEGHWARVESVLSDFLYKKVDNKYFLDLGKGRKFWIDHSLKREDETNDKQVRERIDNFLTDVIESEAYISDIDKITKALGFITRLESSRLMKEIEMRRKIQNKIIPKEKPQYFG